MLSRVPTVTRCVGCVRTSGMWSPAARGDSPQEVVKAAVSMTDDPETAARWRAELAAGRLPQTSEDEP